MSNQSFCHIKHAESMLSLNVDSSLYNSGFEDSDIHDWLVKFSQSEKSNESIGGFLIEAAFGTSESGQNISANLGFRLATHIRLTQELGALRYLPIVILGLEDSISEILENQEEKIAIIALTPGTRYAQDWETAQRYMEELKPLEPSNIKTEVLDQLLIRKPDEFLSNHSISNQWGAYKLDLAAKTNALKKDDNPIFKQLYFKYLVARTEKFDQYQKGLKVLGYINLNRRKSINSRNRRILFIDDEADKGWKQVLEKLLIGNVFEVLNKNREESESDFIQRAMGKSVEDWDLILLDLRLTEADHRENEPLKSKQGYRILQKIKDQNEGTQVLLFTASNRSTHMQELAQVGANGFFVKEGPELSAVKGFSDQNFNSLIDQITQLLGRSDLRTIFPLAKELESILPNNRKGEFKAALELLRQYSSDNPKLSNYSFLAFYIMLESICKDGYRSDQYGDFVELKKEKKKVELIQLSDGSIQTNILAKISRRELLDFHFEESFIPVENQLTEQLIERDSPHYVKGIRRTCSVVMTAYGEKSAANLDLIRLNTLRNNLAHGKENTDPAQFSDILMTIEHIKKVIEEVNFRQ